jgi:surface antigen
MPMNRQTNPLPWPAPNPSTARGANQRRASWSAAATALTALAMLLQGCGMLSTSSSSASEPAPAAPPATDAARASGKAPLLVSTRSGREGALAIEQAMDASDIVKLGSVLIIAGSVTPQSWRNPTSGREFTVTPMRSFAGDQGVCREFSVDVTANARTERMSGAACQGADQRWRVLR